MVLMILTISIISINVSEVQNLQNIADDVVARGLAERVYWQIYYNNAAIVNSTEMVNNKLFNILVYVTPGPSPQNIIINVPY